MPDLNSHVGCCACDNPLCSFYVVTVEVRVFDLSNFFQLILRYCADSLPLWVCSTLLDASGLVNIFTQPLEDHDHVLYTMINELLI